MSGLVTSNLNKDSRKGQSASIMYENLQEFPLKLIVNDRFYAEFTCTPTNIPELVVGMLVSSGKVISQKDFVNIGYNVDTSEVHVSTKVPLIETQKSFSETVIAALREHEMLCTTTSTPDLPFDIMNKLCVLGQQMQQLRSTGLHGAMICENEETFFHQDISRHCAIDKAIGSSIISGMDMASSILFTTGRISSELLWKARILHIPIIASIKYPSRTGEIVASAWGITLACNILSQEAKVLLPK